MIAYSRGCERLAGAASLKYGVPAIVRAFSFHCGYSSLVERQPDKLLAAGSNPAIQANAVQTATHTE